MHRLFQSSSSAFKDFSDIIPTVNNNGYLLDEKEGIRRSILIKDRELRELIDDRLTTIYDLLSEGVRMSRKQPFLGSRPSPTEPYQWMSYGEVFEQICDFGSGVISQCSLKSSIGNCLGIYASNCIQWLITQYACCFYSFISVPLYETLGMEALTHICSHTELSVCLCDSSERVRNLLRVVKSSSLKHIILINANSDLNDLRIEAQPAVQIHTFEEIVNYGALHREAIEPAKPSDNILICYTSGTTGLPKGVLVTNRMLIASVSGCLINSNNFLFTSRDVHLSYLPLAHIYEQFSTTLALCARGRIGFFSGDITRLPQDAQALQPTYFAAVPRVLFRLQQIIHARVKGSKLKTKLLSLGIRCKLKEVNRQVYNHKGFWDKFIFNDIRKNFGGRIRVIICAGAPISNAILQFTRAVFSCPVLEGYGSTETSGAITSSICGDLFGGIVGPPLPNCSIKLCDVPQLGLVVDRDFRGEVCCKGPICTAGYFKDEQLTRDLIDDEGWLHTGDVAEWTEMNSLHIVDRCKHIFKLAHGEYLAPEKIELVYILCPYISQIFVDGNPLYSYPVAIVVPNEENLRETLTSQMNMANGTVPSMAQAGDQVGEEENSLVRLCRLPESKRLILDSLKQLGRNSGLKGFEIVCGVHLISQPFTVENGLLTPTMKLARHKIRGLYLNSLNDLYSECLLHQSTDKQ